MKQKATLIIDGKDIDVKIDKKKRCIEIAEEDLKKLIKNHFRSMLKPQRMMIGMNKNDIKGFWENEVEE